MFELSEIVKSDYTLLSYSNGAIARKTICGGWTTYEIGYRNDDTFPIIMEIDSLGISVNIKPLFATRLLTLVEHIAMLETATHIWKETKSGH